MKDREVFSRVLPGTAIGGWSRWVMPLLLLALLATAGLAVTAGSEQSSVTLPQVVWLVPAPTPAAVATAARIVDSTLEYTPIGVVASGTKSLVACPPTQDRRFVAEVLEGLPLIARTQKHPTEGELRMTLEAMSPGAFERDRIVRIDENGETTALDEFKLRARETTVDSASRSAFHTFGNLVAAIVLFLALAVGCHPSTRS